MIRRPLLSLLSVASLAACAPAPAVTPSPAPTATASTDTASPAAPTPEPSCAAPLTREDGQPIYAASLAGYAAVNGLDVKGVGSSTTLVEPLVTLRLAAYPGTAAVTLQSGTVVFQVNGQALSPQPFTFDTVTLPPGPDVSFGAVQSLNTTLPANSLKGQLGAVPANATISATLTFKDDKGQALLNENLDPLTVTIPLSTSTTSTPAVNNTLIGCGQ